jgi:hypothetical protein
MRWLFLIASIALAALAALAFLLPPVVGNEPEWRRLSVVCIAFIFSYALLRKAFPGKGALVVAEPSGTPGMDDNLRLFVGRNREYYFTKWSGMMRRRSAFSWNWAAFLFGPFWLVYRKMYLAGSIAVIAIVATNFVDSATSNGATSYTFLDGIVLALWFFLSLLGNFIYKTHADKKIAHVVSLDSANTVPHELAKQGGTNIGASLGLCVVFAFLTVVPVVLNDKQQTSGTDVQAAVQDPSPITNLSCEYMDVSTSHSITYDIDRTKATINGTPADGAAHPTKIQGESYSGMAVAEINDQEYVFTLDIPTDELGGHVRETQTINRYTGHLDIHTVTYPTQSDSEPTTASVVGSCQDVTNQSPKF